MLDNRSIGVFDSGLGGLTCVKEIMHLLPHENVIYFGDTGRVPYGTRSPETIIKYSVSDVNFLKTFDIKAVVIACGTVSSIAMEYLTSKFDIPIIGVVEPAAAAAVNASKNNNIGIIGTSGTIASGKYAKHIKILSPTATVTQTACPLFVPFVESGFLYHPATKLIAEEY
ncbi:MAG: glutamate racemase, partial [Monoglobales bacterium]